MKFKTFGLHTSAIFFTLLNLSNNALAGTAGGGGTITFTPVSTATSIPTLSGTMLIVLSLLLFVVAARISKQKVGGSGKFFSIALGFAVLVSITGGVKVISDSHASGSTPISLQAGGSVVHDVGTGQYHFENVSSVPLNVLVEANELSQCAIVCEEADLQTLLTISSLATEFSITLTDRMEVGEFCTINCQLIDEVADEDFVVF